MTIVKKKIITFFIPVFSFLDASSGSVIFLPIFIKNYTIIKRYSKYNYKNN